LKIANLANSCRVIISAKIMPGSGPIAEGQVMGDGRKNAAIPDWELNPKISSQSTLPVRDW